MTLRAEKPVVLKQACRGPLCGGGRPMGRREEATVAKSPVAEQSHFVLKIKAATAQRQIGGPHEAMSSAL